MSDDPRHQFVTALQSAVDLYRGIEPQLRTIADFSSVDPALAKDMLSLARERALIMAVMSRKVTSRQIHVVAGDPKIVQPILQALCESFLLLSEGQTYPNAINEMLRAEHLDAWLKHPPVFAFLEANRPPGLAVG